MKKTVLKTLALCLALLMLAGCAKSFVPKTKIEGSDLCVKKVENLPDNADFFRYQKHILPCDEYAQSHNVICDRIRKCGGDYRYQVDEHPVCQLADRRCDNTKVGRQKGAARSTCFKCNDC